MFFALALIAIGATSYATPYFRPLNVVHPMPIVGALLDPKDLGQTSAASLLPLITHSKNDGCLLPNIICEDWTPLAVGVSINAGRITLDVGPLGNVVPWLVALVDAAKPEGATNLLNGLRNTGQPVTISAGPVWEYRQITNKGYFRLFTGLALHF